MAELKLFRPDITSSIGNAFLPAIDRAIIGSAMEFCEKTRIWVDDLTSIPDVTADPFEFTLTFPAGRVLVAVQDVFFDGRRVDPENVVNLRRTSTEWHTRKAQRPSHWYMSGQLTIRFWPGFADGVTGSVDLKGAFKPVRSATALEDFLYEEHHDAIVSGAMSRLYKQKGKSWYDPNEAKACKREFNKEVDYVKIRAKKNRTNSNLKQRIRAAC